MRAARSSMSGIIGLLAIGLSVAGLSAPADAAVVRVTEPVATKKAPAEPLSRPDSVSAQVTARATGQRVEDLSRRTETTRVYANPNGSWTSESASEPESAQDDNGVWHEIDTTVVARDGALEPKYAAADLRISDGGDKVFAAMTQDGKDLEWRWPTVLPTPVVDGDTVTYSGVAAGGVGDLVVIANASGFTYNVVLREQPTAPVDVVVPVATDGTTLKEAADGSLTVTTKAGDALVTAAPPVMYDAQTNADGDPTNVVPVDTTVTRPATGPSKLTLSPDEDFLADPDTVYPVTVDPTFNSSVSDGWMQYPDYQSMQGSGEELRVGTKDGGTHKARTFMHFNVAGEQTWAGTIIDSASLVLRNFDSYTCTSGAIQVARITVPWGAFENQPAVTWTTQPHGSGEISSTDDVTFAPAYGGPTASCSTGDDATWNVTAMTRVWAANPSTDHGVRIQAVDETSNNTYRRYRSANYTTNTALRPRLVVNWHTLPDTAQTPDVWPTTSYTPPGGAAATYTSWAQPYVSSWVTDQDGGNGTILFRFYPSGSSSWYTSCQASYATPNTFVSCQPTNPLPDGTYTVRAKAADYYNWSGGSLETETGWSPRTTFTVAQALPVPPQISCGSGYPTGSWSSTPPSNNLSCTITATGSGTSAPGSIAWSVDGGTEVTTVIRQSSDPAVAKTTVTLPKTLGSHSIVARAVSPSGVSSGSQTYGVGFGPFTMTKPVSQPSGRASLTSTGRIVIQAQGPGGANGTPTVKWRIAGTGGNDQTGWTTASAPDLKVTSANNVATVSGTVDASTFAGIDNKRTNLIELQVCLNYTGTSTCTWSTSPVTVLKVPHAFDSVNPVTAAGPGSASLLTGEFMMSETDVNEQGYDSQLSISRTHSTFGGPDGGNGIFGPGWTDSLDGPGTGMSGSDLIDSSLADGTIALLDPEGGVSVWAPSLPLAQRTASSLQAGAWVPVDDDTRLSGVKLSIAGTGASTQATITEVDGTQTIFTAVAAPAAGQPFQFAATSVQEPGQASKTTYSTNAAGQVTRILSPVPAGVTCPASGTLNPGCRALTLTYGQSGNTAGRLTQVNWVNGATSTPVETYAYDASGRLTSATNARTGLTTAYTYDGSSGRLTSDKPAGLSTYRFSYDSDGRLKDVQRDKPTGTGTSLLATFRYGIPLDGSASLPDVRATAVSQWAQQAAPTYGAAVFGQTAPSIASAIADISSSDWKWADLSFTDDQGRTTNTAQYGSSRWLLTANDYDELDNVVRSLDAGDVANIQDNKIAAADAGTLNSYDAVKNAAGTVTVPAGSVLTESFAPARNAVVNDAGDVKWVRPHTRYSYDEGAPNDGIRPGTSTGYSLRTKTVVRPWDVASGADITDAGTIQTVTRSGYDPVVAGDKSGWDLGQPTTSVTEMGGGQADIVSTTRYDDEGRVIETRQPKSDGTDAGTRQTVYYTAGSNAADAACGSKPEWAGLLCVTRYAGAAADAPPTSRVASYNGNLKPLTTDEWVNGTKRRTTTNTYDAAGRSKAEWTTSNVAGSTFASGQQSSYSPTTGLVTSTQAVDASGNPVGAPVSTGYDDWGRTTSYTPTPGEVTSSVYDDKGQLASVTDPRGTTTYSYDGGSGNDADGKTERRGVLTKVTSTRPGAADVTFTGAYDANGTLVTQTLPGGLTQHSVTDTAGELVSMSYTGQVTTPDGNGGTTTDPNGTWLAWSQQADVLGRTVRETTPDGTGAGASGAFTKAYTYDQAGRLTKVVDRSAPAGCQTRTYSFDANGNRTQLERRGANADGTCSTDVASTKPSSYDAADRFSGGGYAYDALGRATSMPAADSPMGTSAGDVTLGYYDTDAVRTITQNGATSTYTLDAAGRRSVEATQPAAGAATTVTSHFTDSSDNPSWTQKTDGTTTTTSRYLESLGGDLSATLTSNGTSATATSTLSLALVNPHGDIVTTVSVPASGPCTGIDSWSSYDEYGNTVTGTIGDAPLKSTTGNGYGWVGKNRRATQATGLILMGARVYDPATGVFTSMDTVYRGNSTTYAYPQDPANSYDLTGRCWYCGIPSWGVSHAWEQVGHMASNLSGGLRVLKTVRSWVTFGYTAAQANYDARFIVRVLYDDFHSWGRRYDPKHRRALY